MFLLGRFGLLRLSTFSLRPSIPSLLQSATSIFKKSDGLLLQSATTFFLLTVTSVIKSATGIARCDNFTTKCDRYLKKATEPPASPATELKLFSSVLLKIMLKDT